MINGIGQKLRTKRWYLQGSELENVLLLSCAFSILLWAIRFVATGSLMHGFLIWNLFLAYIPYRVTNYLGKTVNTMNKFVFWLVFLTWLLFIPNSFYIITDLFHLDEGRAAPQWYDLTLIFSFAWNGIILGILSLHKMERIIEAKFNRRITPFFVYGIMWLNALGIYIGRYLRFNSWDIITNPFGLAADITYLCIHPFRNFMEWAMIFCFSFLMTFIYLVLRKLNRE